MKSDRVYLYDMLAAAQNMHMFVDEMTPEAFANDIRTVRAVAFELLAIGEAAKSVSYRVQQSLPQIPWSDLRLVRNTIAHEHFALNPYTLYRTAMREIPPIANALKEVMGEGK
jgi:uncharacterized protein with HEPN domain